MSERYYNDDGKTEEQRREEALTAYREREIQKQEELMQQYQNRVEENRRKREQAKVSQEPMRVSGESVKRAIKKQEEAQKKENRRVIFQLFLMSLSLTLSLAMLDAPILLICTSSFLVFSPLLFGSFTYSAFLYCAYDFVRPILYIWALVVTIQGKQDFFAIAFYILTGLQAISIVKRLMGTVGIIIIALTDNKN